MNRPSRNWLILRYVVGFLAILGLVGLGAIAALLFHQTPPPIVKTDPKAIERLERDLRIAKDAATTIGAPQLVEIDEAELNAILPKLLSSKDGNTGSMTVEDIKCSLVQDRILVHFLLNVEGKRTTMDFEGRVSGENGHFVVDPISGKFGAIPIPKGTLEKSITQLTNSPSGTEKLRLPSNVSGFQITGGKIALMIKQ